MQSGVAFVQSGLAAEGYRSILVLMSEQINHVAELPRIAPFDGNYRAVLTLLEEARAFASALRDAAPGPPPEDGIGLERLEASCEALRVTARLTHCLAWVLTHKAIHAGELGPEAARDPANRLSGGAVCLAISGESNPRLPTRLRSLLAASRMLYVRIARLDARLSARFADDL